MSLDLTFEILKFAHAFFNVYVHSHVISLRPMASSNSQHYPACSFKCLTLSSLFPVSIEQQNNKMKSKEAHIMTDTVNPLFWLFFYIFSSIRHHQLFILQITKTKLNFAVRNFMKLSNIYRHFHSYR